MVRQGFLTHLETQGEVLEGFVLMAWRWRAWRR